jgi:carboxypeptidase Taq
MNAFEKLKPFLEEFRKKNQLMSILNYDIATNTPEQAIEEESDLLNDLASQQAAMQKDPAFIQAVKEAAASDLTPRQRKVVSEYLREIEFFEKIPLEEYEEFSRLASKSNEMWRKYKPTGDFASWLPYWEKMIASFRHLLSYRQKPGMSLYEAALDRFEPGEKEEDIDRVFIPLKEFLLRKIPEAIEKQKRLPVPVIPSYPKHKQEQLSLALLALEHYDMCRGCIRESEHPFSDFTGHFDSRVTTHYYEEDWRSSAFSVLHEGGHCLEFQGWTKEMMEDYADALPTAAICETHSRFYENIIGRSLAFAPHFKKACEECLGEEFAKMGDKEFLSLINRVEPIPNRCDSDELTYCMHIIIRYEIERDLINGKIACKDVPAIWNKKYLDYLGVKVPDDGEGCMQDIHWTDGEIGYFPSYALGNMYGAQILETIKKDLPFEEYLRQGKMKEIKAWFDEKDFPYDWMDPADWIKQVTGKPLDPSYYIAYLDKKF